MLWWSKDRLNETVLLSNPNTDRNMDKKKTFTVLPAKSDSDVVFCLQLLRKTLHVTFTLQLS